jgi:hypothetical protein
MKKRLRNVSAFALLSAVIAAGTVVHAARTGPPSPMAVNSMIAGYGIDSSPTYRIQSDQLGAYTNSKDVQSIIQGVGAWVLDTNYSSRSTRSVLLDFRDPIPGSGPSGARPVSPFAVQLVKARLIAICNFYGVSMLNMYGVGSNIVCPLAVAFDYNGSKYRLAMNSDNFPETQPVSITCMRVVDPANATSQCNQWKIEPLGIQPDGQKKNVAKLLKVSTNAHQPDQDNGDFYMSFAIDITNP